ncbi:glyoxalase [Streptomyces eurocidicus]|uniref:Catechol 2,3-dioxygenase-like lactoylglutathione lyase family enzyme n=1 Tax=Streptomyces eurocidicus TaxID=66423 RepID=A0A2N8NT45_STREU|nr:VOC family protein [Streptomyces eurocidicus]MBB5120171.1 catechol 2,3-dioxygenase-like lactoylglutathione lyase family enzyme [Streptomyces eurocidicus]MBF6051099.1 VOC family protein [Streptomyces eurocidicus]PNE31924.1 glyoxalase [Streptomyces eurocidicus]
MSYAKITATVIDCPDPLALAGFYAGVLGGRIEEDPEDADWVDLRLPDGGRLAFQRAPGLVPPEWPSDTHPQQLHLDLDVTDMESAHARVLELGAKPLDVDDDGGRRDFRVYADPAGHPFCLIRSV